MNRHAHRLRDYKTCNTETNKQTIAEIQYKGNDINNG